MGPLNGIRVLDLSRFHAGPLCGMLIADMGADVIRIEEPGGGPDRTWGQLGPDGEWLPFKITGRNKRAITLRLDTEKGKQVLRQLVKYVDVVLHNFTPGTRLSTELRYDSLKTLNDKIIVAALSGYGKKGPYAEEVCFDATAQARSGGMLITGFSGDPPLKTSITYVDFCAGLSLTIGILLALYHRKNTGIGQDVDVSLFDIAFFTTQATGALLLYHIYGELRTQVGNCGFQTYGGCFEAKDGWVMIAPPTNLIWNRFVKAIGKKEMGYDPKFGSDMDRFNNAELIDSVVKEWVAQRTVEEVTRTLRKARVPCSVVNTVDKLIDDPQVKANEMINMINHRGLGGIPLPGIPIKLSKSPGNIKSISPKIGEHNEEIYLRLMGLSPEEFDQLKKDSII
jgi:CoA:oxalate CoA-transferase